MRRYNFTETVLRKMERGMQDAGAPSGVMVTLGHDLIEGHLSIQARKVMPNGKTLYNRKAISETVLATSLNPVQVVHDEWLRCRDDLLREFDNFVAENRRPTTTMTNANQALREAYAPAARAQLDDSWMLNQTIPKKEGPTMTDFNETTVYMTDDQVARARSGEMKRAEALGLLTETLLPLIEINEGDVVLFSDGNRNSYEIVRVEGGTVLTRRLKANTAGPAGEVNQERLANIESAVREGRATINEEVSA